MDLRDADAEDLVADPEGDEFTGRSCGFSNIRVACWPQAAAGDGSSGAGRSESGSPSASRTTGHRDDVRAAGDRDVRRHVVIGKDDVEGARLGERVSVASFAWSRDRHVIPRGRDDGAEHVAEEGMDSISEHDACGRAVSSIWAPLRAQYGSAFARK